MEKAEILMVCIAEILAMILPVISLLASMVQFPSFNLSLPFLSVHLVKQFQQRGVSLNLSRVGGGGIASVPGSPARELSQLVQLQRNKLQALESRLLGCEAELRDWEEATGEASDVSKTTAASAVTERNFAYVLIFRSSAP